MTDDTTKTDRGSTVEGRSADVEPGVQAAETTVQNDDNGKEADRDCPTVPDGGTTRRDTLRSIGALAALGAVGAGQAAADQGPADDDPIDGFRPGVGYERADPDRHHKVNAHVDLELPREIYEQMPDRDDELGELSWLFDQILFEYRLFVDGEEVAQYDGFDPDVIGDTFVGDDGPEIRTDGGVPRRGALAALGAIAAIGLAGVGTAGAVDEAGTETDSVPVDEYDDLPFTVRDGEPCPFCQEGALERAGGEALRCPECDEEQPASWFATITHREEFKHTVDVPVRVPEAILKAARDTPDADDPDRLYDALLNHVTSNFVWYGSDGKRLPEFEDYYNGIDY